MYKFISVNDAKNVYTQFQHDVHIQIMLKVISGVYVNDKYF